MVADFIGWPLAVLGAGIYYSQRALYRRYFNTVAKKNPIDDVLRSQLRRTVFFWLGKRISFSVASRSLIKETPDLFVLAKSNSVLKAVYFCDEGT